MNSYLAQRRKKKKRKQEGGGGKWPRAYSSLDGHSEENRTIDYGHKDDSHEEGKTNQIFFFLSLLSYQEKQNFIDNCVACLKNFYIFFFVRVIVSYKC